MVNESTEIYRVWLDRTANCPTLRIEWKIKTDPLPKFIEQLDDWQKEKVYDYMREYIMTKNTKGNTIHIFYKEYNNRKGIKELKQLFEWKK